MRALAASALVMLLAGCAAPASLGVIDNVLSHEGPPPPSPPIVRELLARPLDALDARAIFARSVPASLARLAQPPRQDLEPSIERFLDELAEAQRALRAAVPALPPLEARMPPPALQRQIAASIDPAPFLEAIARFLRQRIVYPDGGARFERGDIVVILGTPGDDVHELAPLRDGAVRVLLDPGGNDVYRGPDVVLHGLAAIVDLAGDDRYESDGPAWGAAIAGVSLLLDAGGNDVYEAQDFSIGAALAGLGAVLDLAGDDQYRVRAFGQGLGLARGTGILWDRAGNDQYRARGLPDPFDRGGGLELRARRGRGRAHGAGRRHRHPARRRGRRRLRSPALCAGRGLLLRAWPPLGPRRQRPLRGRALCARSRRAPGRGRAARRLGQRCLRASRRRGPGHGARSRRRRSRRRSGDDRYSAPTLAQGAATANGVGIVSDNAGTNEWY
jgi:hypothetical protein